MELDLSCEASWERDDVRVAWVVESASRRAAVLVVSLFGKEGVGENGVVGVIGRLGWKRLRSPPFSIAVGAGFRLSSSVDAKSVVGATGSSSLSKASSTEASEGQS